MICLKEHIWGVICYILTPDGRFRLTTKPTLVWPNGILTCRFSPVPSQEVEQLFALRGSSPPYICACRLFHCSSAVYRQGCLPLATPETGSLCGSYLFKGMFCRGRGVAP